MRVSIVIIITLVSFSIKAQSFYEKMMIMNIAIADTSTDWSELERSAGVFDRISKGMYGDWLGNYYKALCYLRVADILIKNDSLYAKKKIELAKKNLRLADSIVPNESETKILKIYGEIIQMRIAKNDEKKIKALEADILKIEKNNLKNPRIYVLRAYYQMIFYPNNKSNSEKVIENLKIAHTLYVTEKPDVFLPRWGKKWAGELLKKMK